MSDRDSGILQYTKKGRQTVWIVEVILRGIVIETAATFFIWTGEAALYAVTLGRRSPQWIFGLGPAGRSTASRLFPLGVGMALWIAVVWLAIAIS